MGYNPERIRRYQVNLAVLVMRRVFQVFEGITVLYKEFCWYFLLSNFDFFLVNRRKKREMLNVINYFG